MKLWNFLSVLSVAVLAISCGSHRDLSSFPGLEERVRQYYELEKTGDWSAAFEFRTSDFRKSVPKDRYIALMQRDSSGWRFVDYRVKSVMEEAGRVKLEVVFREVPPKDFLPAPELKGKELGPIEFEDQSIWIREEGNWYSHAPGKRAHLTLNSAIVQR